MMVIDTHLHFWKYDPATHGWINDEMTVLKKDFLPADLQPVLNDNGVDGCIAVQADQSEAETHFLLNCARRFDFVKGIVGWVDLRSPDVEERLQVFSRESKLCGFRHIVQSEPDEQFMLRSDFQHGISLLAKYNFTYDILVFPNQLPAALQLVKYFPEQKFVIDHLAKPYLKTGKIEEWAGYIRQIGAARNTWCKLSGIVTEADWNNWSYEQIKPYLEVVLEAFGPDRLLFGSDWPVCLLAATYREVKQLIERFTQELPASARDKIFFQNAIDFYGLA